MNFLTQPTNKLPLLDLYTRIFSRDSHFQKRCIAVVSLIIGFTMIITLTVLALPDITRAPGVLLPAEYQAIYAQASGIIQSINIQNGAIANKEDLLLQLDYAEEENRINHYKQNMKQCHNKIASLKEIHTLQTQQFHTQIQYLKKNQTIALTRLHAGSETPMQINQNQNEINTLEVQLELHEKNFIYTHNEIIQEIEFIERAIAELQTQIQKKQIFAGINGIFSNAPPLPSSHINQQELAIGLAIGKKVNAGELIGYLINEKNYNLRAIIPEVALPFIDKEKHYSFNCATLQRKQQKQLKAQIKEITPLAKGGGFIVQATVIDSEELIKGMSGSSIIINIPILPKPHLFMKAQKRPFPTDGMSVNLSNKTPTI